MVSEPDSCILFDYMDEILTALQAEIREEKGRQAAIRASTDLCRICFPTAPRHSLFELCEMVGSPVPTRHTVDDQCEALQTLWPYIRGRLAGLPAIVRHEIELLLRMRRKHPIARLLRDIEAETSARPDDKAERLDSLLDRGPLPPRRPPRPDDEPCQPLDAEEIVSVLDRTGPVASAIEGYEYREEQIEMTRAVVAAFNESKLLLAEAGTGIGKSLAYLVPAIRWSADNNTPVIVSTNTKNLQSQLFEKDLPLIQDVMGNPVRTALIKGRRNYLCVRKLFYLLRSAQQELELNRSERAALAAVLAWAIDTATGDFAETFLEGQVEFLSLAAGLSSTADECPGPECPHRRRCFLYRARRHSLAADVVVANHAVVFSEMNLDSPVLPPYGHLVFDEAHNLEDAATTHFTAEISQARMRPLLRRLGKRGRRRRLVGLPAAIRRQLDAAAEKGRPMDEARKALDQLIARAEALAAEMPDMIARLHEVLDTPRPRETRRILEEDRAGEAWQAVLAAGRNLDRLLGETAESAQHLAKLLGDAAPDALPDRFDFVHDLEGVAGLISETRGEFAIVLTTDEESRVYWVERDRGTPGGARAKAAPIHVGTLLAEELYSRKDMIVFTSATLTVRGQTDFIRKRLGLDEIDRQRIAEINLGTPFDYTRQCLVAAPTFLPDPGADGYTEQLGQLLADVFRRTRGRGMALFTSYDMLRQTTQVLEEHLAGSPIRVLAQGISGSRESITRMFKEDFESVLMGTHSFWEGVDVVGESLSCLVLARLPFAVFTDPIIEARCEKITAEGGDPFIGYSVPNAVIRFRQGFGRLIRHRTDRGVVIVADRRAVKRRYGSWFQTSIPAPMRAFPAQEDLLTALDAFMAEEG